MREPNCTHSPKVRVSSHEDLVAAVKTSDPICSMYSCEREKCLKEAIFYVQGTTGRTAFIVPLPKRVA